MSTNKVSSIPNTLVTGDADAVIAGLLAWIIDPNGTRHATVTGGPGAGKTWLIKRLLETHKSYKKLGFITSPSLKVCGTTHESLGVIKEDLKDDSLRTLYSLLQLVPVKGVIHKRFGSFKKAAKYDPKPKEIDKTEWRLVCDESNFISQETLTIIDKWFPNLKIIYIGSEHQLGTEQGPSRIFEQGYANFFLSTSFRADNADVQEVYDVSEQDVINKSTPRHVQNDSIIYLNGDDWEATIKKAFTSENAHKCVVLAHTNKRVFELVGMIRKAQGRPGYFDLAGPTQALRPGSGLIPKKNVTLRQDSKGRVYIPVKTESGERRSYVGETYEHYEYLIKKTRKFQEIYPSLVASKEATTIHGAQGGTWDYAFLDLTNLYPLRLRDMETYRRAKHVGESRHRTKLFIKLN